MGRTTTKHFSWTWQELPGPEGAAFAEAWTYSDDGALLGRRRIPMGNKPARPTISTDPRAGAIMRGELGLRGGRPMGGPHP